MNKKNLVVVVLISIGFMLITPLFEAQQIRTSALVEANGAIIADHTVVNYIRLDMIPDENITNAKNTLHIAYEHTSHGSQISDGMAGLPTFKEGLNGTEGLYDFNNGGTGGALDFHDNFASGDLGNPDRETWASLTRDYLDDPANSDVNVVMWSWCGQVSSASESDIETYLNLMTELENDYPSVKFVYMTGHVNGDGLEGNTHVRNEQIRDYVRDNGKILFDFADIESYDPDGSYYGDKYVTDGCCYDYNGNNDTEYTGDPETPINGDRNWAQDWQESHTEGEDWYDCGSAHTEPLNANMKAYAVWWLWATLAGYNTTEAPPTFTPTSTPEPTSTDPFSAVGIITTFLGLLTTIITIQIVKRKKF
jgi:hypothetical protein